MPFVDIDLVYRKRGGTTYQQDGKKWTVKKNIKKKKKWTILCLILRKRLSCLGLDHMFYMLLSVRNILFYMNGEFVTAEGIS